MDILAHGLWTNVVYRVLPKTKSDQRLIKWGIVLGVLPDLVSFGPIFALRIFWAITGVRPYIFQPVEFEQYPLSQLTYILYNFTHSLVIWTIVTVVIWLILKKFPWMLLAWGLHIAIDIFSHTNIFFPTPFLFPLSDFKISVISWAHPMFMLINYGLLLVFYTLLLPRLRKSI